MYSSDLILKKITPGLHRKETEGARRKQGHRLEATASHRLESACSGERGSDSDDSLQVDPTGLADESLTRHERMRISRSTVSSVV